LAATSSLTGGTSAPGASTARRATRRRCAGAAAAGCRTQAARPAAAAAGACAAAVTAAAACMAGLAACKEHGSGGGRWWWQQQQLRDGSLCEAENGMKWTPDREYRAIRELVSSLLRRAPRCPARPAKGTAAEMQTRRPCKQVYAVPIAADTPSYLRCSGGSLSRVDCCGEASERHQPWRKLVGRDGLLESLTLL
jgi:hypothetical protein